MCMPHDCLSLPFKGFEIQYVIEEGDFSGV